MLLLLLEIGLMVFAYRRGWKWYSVVPFVLGLAVSFTIGLYMGISDTVDSTEFGMGSSILVGLAVDGLVVLSLATLCLIEGPYAKSKDRAENKTQFEHA